MLLTRTPRTLAADADSESESSEYSVGTSSSLQEESTDLIDHDLGGQPRILQGRATRYDRPCGKGVTLELRIQPSDVSASATQATQNIIAPGGIGDPLYTVSVLPGTSEQTGVVKQNLPRQLVPGRHAGFGCIKTRTVEMFNSSHPLLAVGVHHFGTLSRGRQEYWAILIVHLDYKALRKDNELKPGPDPVEMIAVTSGGMQGGSLKRVAVVCEIALWLADWGFDTNTIVQYISVGDPAFAAITGFSIAVSFWDFYRELSTGARESTNHLTRWEYIKKHVCKSFEKGYLSGALLRLFGTEMYETIATNLVLPYSLMVLDFQWSVPTFFMVISVPLSANARSRQQDGGSEHFNNAFRKRVVESSRGEVLRRANNLASCMGWFPTYAVAGSAFFAAWQNDHWTRHYYLLLFFLIGAFTRAFLYILVYQGIGHFYIGEQADPNRLHMILHMLATSAHLPWHLRRMAATPLIHFGIFVTDNVWKALMIYITCCSVPGASSHFRELFRMHGFSDGFANGFIPIRTIVAYMWLIGSVLHVLLFIASCLIAKITDGRVFRGLDLCLDTLRKERIPELGSRTPSREMQDKAARRAVSCVSDDDD